MGQQSDSSIFAESKFKNTKNPHLNVSKVTIGSTGILLNMGSLTELISRISKEGRKVEEQVVCRHLNTLKYQGNVFSCLVKMGNIPFLA